jgi:N-hydroxyarylamine O-acetyltransferase
VSLTRADFDQYRARIGWDGPVAPDRATLEAIAYHHPLAIPFENLDPLMGRTPDLAPDALMAKLVHGRRGGYCFEQNGLLRIFLEMIGFTVVPLSGRVVWGMDDTLITRRSHMLLRVELAEGPVLIDVGFGSATPTGVLDLVPDRVQQTPHERFRLIRVEGGDWKLQVLMGEQWRTTYRFDTTPQYPIDYTVANWFTSTHPDSHFIHGLACARAFSDRRVTLRGFDLTTYPVGRASTQRALTPSEACDTLEQDFGIALPDRVALLARLTTLHAAQSVAA